jgi:SNF2 family DNA or RNA helicase
MQVVVPLSTVSHWKREFDVRINKLHCYFIVYGRRGVISMLLSTKAANKTARLLRLASKIHLCFAFIR